MAKLIECAKCGELKTLDNYPTSQSKFAMNGKSNICSECLIQMTDPMDLNQIDQLCQWLNIPFDPNQFVSHDMDLENYLQTDWLKEGYQSVNWSFLNKEWLAMRQAHSEKEHLEIVRENRLKALRAKWIGDYEDAEIEYLEMFYQDLVNTQAVNKGISQDLVIKLCKISLIMDREIRAGLSAKDTMNTYKTIMQAAGLETKNTKNIGDFDSASELIVYLYEHGFRPKWVQTPKDDVDFTMRDVQTYLKNLAYSIGNLGEQVADREQIYNTAKLLEEKFEETGEVDVSSVDLSSIQYEDIEEFEEMLQNLEVENDD